jgi:HK97 family phage portal protein
LASAQRSKRWRIQIVPGEDGWPEAYDYAVDGASPIRLDGEAIPGVRRVLHQKLFHPLNDHYGLSPIEAAASAIDIHNAASRWNKALLDNSARPSGALVYTSRDGNLTTEQYDRLKSELESGFQGAGNAGRPLLLEGGLDWKSMSMSPKDLDFMEAKHGAAREIALALGVPPMLLGIPGDNTFSNLQEANRTFWRQTVLPLVQRVITALDEWLTPGYSGALTLKPNIDDLDALSSERDVQWTRLENATFLTDDEKRAAVGYGPKQPANLAIQKFNPNHDAQGRFTTGDVDSGDSKDPNYIPAAAPPRPPKGPPPNPPPKPPAAPPKAPSGRNQSTDEILKPGGQDIGTVEGRARPNIRTVSPSDFEATKNKLLDGAVEVSPPADYKGKWYQRADGTTVGVRESPESGTTLEVVKGNSKIDSGYKVHKK